MTPRGRGLERGRKRAATGFEVIPAIDLLGGRCVRLSQGRYEEATVYDEDPAAVAERFVARGIARLHVVDLDGARAGRPCNGEAIRAVVARAGALPVQVGGGIRSAAAIEECLAMGVDRVILGTAALREPELVRQTAKRFPGRLAVGIDARDGKVAVEGWLEDSEASAPELARRFEDAGVAAIIYTDITRDGMLKGPNLEATAALAAAITLPVILSGGIASEEDVRRTVAYADRGITGAIIGRALYTGAVTLERALEVAACS